MSTFQPPRDRDASDSIRGFVFQVDLTILRLLQLSPDQALELECGEDIDTVRQQGESGDDLERLLEQVKANAKPITLRSRGPLEFLANAVETIAKNKGLALWFRFLTTSDIACEKESPFDPPAPGLVRWEDIRKRALESPEAEQAANGIRKIIESAPCPTKFNGNTWNEFVRWVKSVSVEELLTFIRQVEWSTAALEGSALGRDIEDRLLRLGVADSQERAHEQYQRLFFFVFKLLARRGRKRVTTKERDSELSLPALSAPDAKTLRDLGVLLAKLDDRVTAVEANVGDLSELVVGLGDQVKSLAEAHDIDATVDFDPSALNLEPQPAPAKASARTERTNNVALRLGAGTWLFVYGSYGSGKTQFARLVASKFGKTTWIRMRDLSTAAACRRLDEAMRALGGDAGKNLSEVYQRAGTTIGAGNALVLDDLPKLLRSDELFDRIRLLAGILSSLGVKLITSTASTPPQELRRDLPGPLVLLVEAPPFDYAEAKELFLAYGAPPKELTESRVQFLTDIGRGNPSLLVAMSQLLVGNGWNPDGAAFVDVLMGTYASATNQDTYAALLDSLADPKDRDLVFRLNAIFGPFGEAELKIASSAPPPIDRPFERLSALLGPWIEEESKGRYSPCALAKQLGAKDIPEDTSKALRIALAEHILKKKRLSSDDASSVILHFLNAKEHDRAGVVLVVALASYLRISGPLPATELTSYWATSSLPPEMSVGLQLQIRALQINIALRTGKKPTRKQLEDVDRLLDLAKGEGDAAPALLASLIAGPLSMGVDTGRATKYFLRALELASRVAALPDFPKGPAFQVPIESLIWGIGLGIKSLDDAKAWRDTFFALTSDQHTKAFEAPKADEFCLSATDQVVHQEAAKPAEARNWAEVEALLRDIAEKATARNLPLLYAAASSSLMLAIGEFGRDRVTAISLGEEALRKVEGQAVPEFVLRRFLAMHCRWAGAPEKAYEFYKAALAKQPQSLALERFNAAVEASVIAGSTDPQACIQYCEQAVAVSSQVGGGGNNFRTKALGELALAYWLAGNRSDAFATAEAAVESLLSDKVRSNFWRSTAMSLRNLTAYMASIGVEGKPPKIIEKAGELAPLPERGSFIFGHLELADRFSNAALCQIPIQLTFCAESLGDLDKVISWGLRAVELAREHKADREQGYIALRLVPFLAARGQYEKAIAWTLECAAKLPTRAVEMGAPSSGLSAEEEEKYTHEWARCFVVLMIMPSLGTLAAGNREKLTAVTAQVAEIMVRMGAATPQADQWKDVAALIEVISRGDSSVSSLLEKASQYGGKGDLAGCYACYCGVSIQRSVVPSEAIQAQLVVFDRIYALAEGRSSTGALLSEFVEVFWNYMFEERRFWFKHQTEMKRELEEARGLVPPKRTGKILRAVARAMEMPLPAEIASWLKGL